MGQHAIKITLRGSQNITYTGTLILDSNWTSLPLNNDIPEVAGNSTGKEYDQRGASYYVVAVVLVYGMSIVALIASHIKRRHAKVLEDKQIDKYLQDFQIVREKHDRDNYRKLKRTIMTKINWDRGRRGTVRTLQSSLLPLLAVGIHHGSASNLAIHRASFASRRGSHVQVVDARDRRRIYPRHKGGSSSEEAEISVDIEDNSNSPRGSLRGSHPDIHKQLRENSIPSIPEEEECSSPSPSTKVDAVAAEEDGLAIRKRRAPHIYLTIQPPSEEDLHALTEEGSAKDSTDVVWHQGSPRSPDSGCGNTDSPSSLTPSPSFRSRSPHRTPPLVRQARSTSPPSFIMKNGYGNSLAVPSSSGRDGSPASQRSTISEDSGRGESNQSREHLLHITCL